MKNKGSHGQNRFIRILALPWKALIKARDCYVGTMTNYAVVNPRSLPKSYSVTSSTRSDNSEDFRELVRAASARSMGENFELNLLIQQQIRQQLQQQMPSRRSVPRSVSVGMGRIDEDKPFVLGGQEEDVSIMLMKNDLKYPRSRSHAVSKTTEHAAAGSQVKFLPGFQGPLPFQLETGYVGVGDSEDVQLFYYFTESETDPDSDPLMLWITGGPGCSALSGLLYEIGPITFEAVEYNGSFPKMILNPYSWTKVSSIIFLDLPVGTGFSYATTPAARQSSDLQASDHAYQFLRKWFVDHPEFLKNPFYVGGDSYSGIVVPIITQIIAIKNEMEVEPFINLKGYLLGNPWTFEGEDNYRIPFAYGMGLISEELYESFKSNCKGEYLNINPSNKLCLQDVQTFIELLQGIDVVNILEPNCGFTSPRPHLLFGQRRSLDEKFHQLKCRNNWYKHSYHWADDDQVRNALNIRKGTIGKWERCASNLQYLMMVTNSIPYHENLSSKGYRSLIYSGDHDKLVTFQSTQAWIKSLNYSVVDDWRAWTVDNEVAGYTRSYSNQMTFATVKGAGHTAPEYKPRECLAMLTRWMSYQPL
ncbi:hypothetical protein KY285_022438 [Solanum tuberosum]|nr:hypothetical protein KY285_022438 [Solanum tuberosum]